MCVSCNRRKVTTAEPRNGIPIKTETVLRKGSDLSLLASTGGEEKELLENQAK